MVSPTPTALLELQLLPPSRRPSSLSPVSSLFQFSTRTARTPRTHTTRHPHSLERRRHWLRTARIEPLRTVRPPAAYEEVCFFFTRFTVSRLSTFSSVCEDSKIFMYAASVSAIVLSYSLRDAI